MSTLYFGSTPKIIWFTIFIFELKWWHILVLEPIHYSFTLVCFIKLPSAIAKPGPIRIKEPNLITSWMILSGSTTSSGMDTEWFKNIAGKAKIVTDFVFDAPFPAWIASWNRSAIFELTIPAKFS